VIALTALLPLPALAFSAQWPVDCELGKTCFIQNFIDHDSSQAARDFVCNPHSYNGHDGTDIRLRNLAAMRAGVAIKAVADGVVLGTRNDIADNGVDENREARIKGKECGNGVHLQHADGYRTQYCHMQQGSIRVRTGQQVKAGDALGNIGLSGHTEFPHLHLGIWKNDVALDPFTAAPIATACDAALATTPRGLWASLVPYQPTALLNDGFADATPDKTAMRDIPKTIATLPSNAPALLYWVDMMNLRAGDTITLSITAPDGNTFAERTITQEKPLAAYFGFVGKRNSTGKLAVGTYVAQTKLMRGGSTLLQEKRTIHID
jgi:murein DD-endopeptidase MepM/ murein hydrolase activator NlpD